MARFRTPVESTKSPEEAFDDLAEFSNARDWDPGIVKAVNLTGDPVGPGSRFRLVSRFLGRRVPLEYHITEFDRPTRVVLAADETSTRSTDEIRFVATNGGDQITYEADLRLKTPLGRMMDPLLALAFPRIGHPRRGSAAGISRHMNDLLRSDNAVLEATLVKSRWRVTSSARSSSRTSSCRPCAALRQRA